MLLVALVMLLGAPPAIAATTGGNGTLCISPVPKSNSAETSLGNPSGGSRDFNFSVRVDQRAPVVVSTTQPVEIGNLQLRKKHRVVILRSGKRDQSFSFTFESRGGAKLCLWFKALYETWSLDSTPRSSCKCAGVRPNSAAQPDAARCAPTPRQLSRFAILPSEGRAG